MKRYLLAAAILFSVAAAYAQTTFPTPGTPAGGPAAMGGVGMYVNSSGFAVPETLNDPCANPSSTKASVPISVTSATTTQLVAGSGSTLIYVCGGSFTIAPSATSADTAAFEYGTTGTCATPTLLTGTYGAGDLTTAAPPIAVSLVSSGVVMIAPAGKALCIVTAGTAVNVQGILSYIQQ